MNRYNLPLSLAVAAGLSAAAMLQTPILAQTQPAEGEPETSADTMEGPPEFTDIFGDPLDIEEPMEGETFTAAVEEFHTTGENPYVGDEEAIAEGEILFNQQCSACHGRSATGGMGPSLVDDTFANERVATHQGLFEVIHGGAAGAMPAFGDQLEQDQILQIMAYISAQSES